jgi:hypothetical protein
MNTRRFPPSLLLAAAVALALVATTPSLANGAAQQQGRPASSPGGLDDLHLVGAAERTSDGVLLVGTSTPGLAGAAYTSRVNVTAFVATMTFSIQGDCSDGIALVVQDQGPNALGGGVFGGNIGYGDKGQGSKGIKKSLAFELDSYHNKWDPPVPQLSLQTRGHAQNNPNSKYSLASMPTTPVADGSEHTLVVSYDGTTAEVKYDGTTLVDQPVNLATLLGLSDGTAFLGATAQNGGCTADVLVSAFNVTT